MNKKSSMVDQEFPLELKVPNAETLEAMAEVDEMVNTRAARFASADEMCDDTDGPTGSVYFARAGTHAQLFK